VSKQLVGILLIVFVKKDLHSCFTGIMESSVATGFMVSVAPFRQLLYLKRSFQGLMVSRKAQSNSGTVKDSSCFSLGKQRSGGCSNKLPTKPNFLLAVSAASYIYLRQFPLSCLR
jgi:hypothetical protein